MIVAMIITSTVTAILCAFAVSAWGFLPALAAGLVAGMVVPLVIVGVQLARAAQAADYVAPLPVRDHKAAPTN